MLRSQSKSETKIARKVRSESAFLATKQTRKRETINQHHWLVDSSQATTHWYPKNELAEKDGMVVFPSNAQLSVRAHGIADMTLRRHLAVLVGASLIYRRDSPNGKRYMHRYKAGGIEQVYGFSLAPLLARVEELAHMVQEVAEERWLFKSAKEALTICRRDIRKLITAGVEEGADSDWPQSRPCISR